MKMKKIGIVIAASLVCAFTAHAEKATMEQAMSVARAIVARGATMGEKLGAAVESVVESTETNAPYYAVKMRGGGTVITSGDTDLEPVVAILPGNADFRDLPTGHPLRELLKRDLALRQRFLDDRKRLPVVSVMSVNAASAAKQSRGKWETLLAEDEARNRPRLMSVFGFGGIDADGEGDGSYPPVTEQYKITDMRVEPLVKATWSQSNNGENEFTPEHSVCGCVATATAQIMHYHQWPTNEFATFKNTCSFNGTRKEYESLPGPYDWENMPANNSWATQTEREAIGKLTYNCGVAVGMMWTPRSSGASSLDIPDAYTKYLGYAQALQVVDYFGNLELHTEDSFKKYLYPSLDAGYPVQIGIADSQGSNGHSIVGDGYGYLDDGEEKIPYVHINMGWGNGDYNAWYNFPNVPYTATVDGEVTEYVIVTTLTYNILPEFPEPKEPGQSAYIISGRALDEEDNPLQDAEIEVINADGVVVSTVTSGVHGVWGAALACNGPYTIVANLESQGISGEIANVPFSCSVNSWGNEIRLTNFSVENLTTHAQYSSLNRAIANAAENDVLEVFTQSVFSVSCTIDKPLTIRGRDSVDPQLLRVAVASDVSLGVDAGGELTVSNLTFTLGASNFDERSLRADVAADGRLRIENVNGFGEITLRSADSFVFAGEVTNAVYIVSKGFGCAADNAFGRYEGDAAKGCANYLLNDADDELGGLANDSGLLVWAEVPVPDAAAGVKLTLGGETTNYRTLAALMRHCSGDAEIEIVRNGAELNEPLPVSNALTIFAGADPKTIRIGAKANFDIAEGGSLMISNVVMSAGKGDALFTIENGGEMTLEAGAEIFGFSGTSDSETYILDGAGVIRLNGGRFTLRPGAMIRDCSTGGNGGAIYAQEGTIALEGGLIQNCTASGMFGGGAICAYVPATRILVSGEPVISGNAWYSNGSLRDDNLHLIEYPTLDGAPIELAGAMGLNAQIGLSFNQYMTEPYGGEKGDIFATVKAPVVSLMSVSAPMTMAEKALTAHAFVNDAAPEDLMAAWSEDENELLWVENTLKGEVAPGTEALATVRTTAKDGKERLYYNLSDAFRYLPSAGLVELLTNEVAMVGDIAIPYAATITTMAETNEIFAIVHVGEVSGSLIVPAGVSLNLTNLDFVCVGQAHQRAIEVDGGSLTLEAGTTVFGYAGFDTRASSVIVVWNGGSFTMKDGSVIHSCRNTYVDSAKNVDSGAGGAVLIDGIDSKGYFLGGVITNCYAVAGGGVAVCNEATAYVSGNLLIAANHEQDPFVQAVPSDFVVEDKSKLYLAAPLADTAKIGRLTGFRADTNLVAYVDNWRDWDFTTLTNSAAKFFNDEAVRVHGFVVTNESDTALVVWSTSIAEDGSFIQKDDAGNETTFFAVAEVPEVGEGEDDPPEPGPEPVDPPAPAWDVITNYPTPIAFRSISRLSETEWALVVTDRVEFCNYRLLSTDDLAKGFTITGAWEQAHAAGAWATNVTTVGGAWFWRAEGTEGTNVVPHVEK